MQQDKTWSNRIFDFVNHGLLLLIGIVTVIPFIYILAVSFTSPHEVAKGGFILFPKEFSLAAYRYIFSTDTLIRSLGVSIYITVVGTLINLLFTSLMAYPLSRKYLRGRQPILLGVLFTMLFSGGMIPTYFVVKSLHLTDTLWSLMLPTAISAFNLIVLKNFFQAIPDELEDAAKIDGCNDVSVLFRIVLPLSMPAMATFSLFYAVAHWNSFFSAVIYINDSEKWPVQVWLREIVILAQSRIGDTSIEETEIQPLTIRMAVIVFSTIPIMLVYPFLQKHFAKGVMLGSVKG
ncbi:carbohydrate ABC transporter permease [Paenibacillus polysaccharolyticus]|uniref:Carbohydrate ABC transporter permease n=2 Tax=Paenibacillus TaxID=44249 RepID=A0ABS7KED7_9BACL|nr:MULTISPECIES: carbohydrate ABC transporter permease [Paenibacillus]MBY0202522.1 carbohydrate ABC transporter permease [Paenibacillus cucumis (ex Kampfer et al. 2016)]MCP1132314.1 carbohydrate ABC transporter permease [Paenibacillus polysaccharolyticus]MDP9701851.1 putative aldouronate transport system permease protein [Paenibacillus intestini]SCX91218.1 putative aldouronate transport system permease protein [Paenibacillus polysaccharolyticus]